MESPATPARDSGGRMSIGDYSILILEGDRHRRERKLLMPPFHGDRMRAYGQTICELTEGIFSQLELGTTFSARNIVQDISIVSA